jgi:hypothetical protein
MGHQTNLSYTIAIHLYQDQSLSDHYVGKNSTMQIIAMHGVEMDMIFDSVFSADVKGHLISGYQVHFFSYLQVKWHLVTIKCFPLIN